MSCFRGKSGAYELLDKLLSKKDVEPEGSDGGASKKKKKKKKKKKQDSDGEGRDEPVMKHDEAEETKR